MPYTSKQKALLLSQLDVKLGASFSQKLGTMAQAEFFKADDLGMGQLGKNIEAMHKYKAQLEKGEPTEEWEGMYNRAVNELRSLGLQI